MNPLSLRKYSWIVLGLIIASSIFWAGQLRNISFDYDLEKLFPANAEETLFFQEFRATFENDNDYILIGIRNEEGVFRYDFLSKIDSLSNRLALLPDVDFVQSPTNLKDYQKRPMSAKLMELPILHWKNPDKYKADSLKIYEKTDLVGQFFADQTVLIFVKNTNLLEEEGCGHLYHHINEVLADFEFDELHIAGKCFGQTNFIQMIEREVKVFIGASVLVIMLFLLFSYRTLWGVWMPLSVVGLTVLWTIGIMVFTGKSIDIISNIIPTILLVIGISDTIHLLTNYLHRRKRGEEKVLALKAACKEVGLATMMTTFTTAIGFISLTTSSFLPLVDLGIYATIGLVIALFLTYTLLPALVMLHGPLYSQAQNVGGWADDFLTKCFYWVEGHQKMIMLISAFVVLLGLVGASQIKVNNFLLEDLKESNHQKQAFNFFEDHFAGARSFDMVLSLPDSTVSLFTPEILREIAAVDSFLVEEYGVRNIISPAVFAKQANRIQHNGREKFYKIPEKASQIRQLAQNIDKFKDQMPIDRFLAEDRRSARVSGQIPDLGSLVLQEKEASLYAFIDRLPNVQLDYRITGTPYLLDLNNSFLARNVLLGLAFAIGIIALIFGFLLRSVKMVLLTLIPNLLPLLFIAGVMGFVGIDLKISTSIIFIISFGIAVDDSIHFLSRFRMERAKHPLRRALLNTYLDTGKAISITSIILTSGFMVLCLSDFLGTFYIGLLISITLLVAMIADLTLLPVLLLAHSDER